MDCERARDLILTDWADGELPADEASLLARHLATCAACRVLADRVTAETVMPLRAASRSEPGLALWMRVQAGIRATEHDRPEVAPMGFGPWLAAWRRALALLCRPALAGLALGACIVLGTLWFDGRAGRLPETERQAAASTVAPGLIANPDGQDDVSWYTGDTNFENAAVTNTNFGTAMEACFL